MSPNGVCPRCGEDLVGDGYNVVLHCPRFTDYDDKAPDAPAVFCEDKPKLIVMAMVNVIFPLTWRQMVYLKDLSAKHYDWHCRSVGECGGFLYGWWNMFWPHVGPNTRIEPVSVNRNELDTLLKILEMSNGDAIALGLYDTLRAVRNQMAKYTSEWRVEIEL